MRRVCAMQDECYYPRALTVWPGIWPKARWPSWPAQGPTQATGWPAAAGQLSAGQLDGVRQHLRDSKTTKKTFFWCAPRYAPYIYIAKRTYSSFASISCLPLFWCAPGYAPYIYIYSHNRQASTFGSRLYMNYPYFTNLK